MPRIFASVKSHHSTNLHSSSFSYDPDRLTLRCCSSYFAYLFVRVATQHTTVDVVGHSQLMDAPGQEPSVTLLDWASGNGTAAYWATWLVVRAFAPGDEFVATTSNATAVYAQAWRHTCAEGRPDLPGATPGAQYQRVLLINKLLAPSVAAVAGTWRACTAWTVDQRTGLSPPLTTTCVARDGTVQAQLDGYATVVLQLA